MSYEPTLVINSKQLHAKTAKIESDAIEYPEGHSIQYISQLLRQIPLTIAGVEIIICTSELTMFNKLVREQLYEYDIEYAEEN